jgi:hypothetical protein
MLCGGLGNTLAEQTTPSTKAGNETWSRYKGIHIKGAPLFLQNPESPTP